MERQPNTQYILSLSYGKDSLACLEAVKQLGYPLDRIVHAEIWATDTIHADLPPMVEFKTKADKIIRERYGYDVEHIRGSQTYEEVFYRVRKHSKIQENRSKIYGFPLQISPWCTGELKQRPLQSLNTRGTIQYLGIAADEQERIKRHSDARGIRLPLVDIGWDEAYCRKWCEENNLLSPIYTSAARGGCWFCHNQSVAQLRCLRTSYPDLWKLLLQWDTDSPDPFHMGGHTVHDFDMRFFAEDLGLVPRDRKFRWKKLAVAFDEYLNGLSGGD